MSTQTNDRAALVEECKGLAARYGSLRASRALAEAEGGSCTLIEQAPELAKVDLFAAIDRLAALPVQPEPKLALEAALSELVDKIIPGLDSGDLLADAKSASEHLSENALRELSAEAQTLNMGYAPTTLYVYRWGDGRTQVKAPGTDDPAFVIDMLEEALRAMNEGNPVSQQ
jgi:hypothetical protein